MKKVIAAIKKALTESSVLRRVLQIAAVVVALVVLYTVIGAVLLLQFHLGINVVQNLLQGDTLAAYVNAMLFLIVGAACVLTKNFVDALGGNYGRTGSNQFLR